MQWASVACLYVHSLALTCHAFSVDDGAFKGSMNVVQGSQLNKIYYCQPNQNDDGFRVVINTYKTPPYTVLEMLLKHGE